MARILAADRGRRGGRHAGERLVPGRRVVAAALPGMQDRDEAEPFRIAAPTATSDASAERAWNSAFVRSVGTVHAARDSSLVHMAQGHAEDRRLGDARGRDRDAACPTRPGPENRCRSARGTRCAGSCRRPTALRPGAPARDRRGPRRRWQSPWRRRRNPSSTGTDRAGRSAPCSRRGRCAREWRARPLPCGSVVISNILQFQVRPGRWRVRCRRRSRSRGRGRR